MSEGDVRRGVSRSSVSALKKRAGTPSCAATACTAGSAALRPIEATQATDCGARLASRRQRSTRRPTSSLSVRRSQPMPSTSVAGLVDQIRRRIGAFGDQDGRRLTAADRLQPGGIDAGLVDDLGLGAVEQRRHDRLHRSRILDAPVRRRLVESEPELHVARGCDRGMAADRRRNLAREIVGTVMAAQQRHDGRPVLGDGDHRRIDLLALQRGAQRADQDAGRTDADDRPAFGEELGQMRMVSLKLASVSAPRAARPWISASPKAARIVFCEPQRRGAEDDDCRNIAHDQASPRLCTRSMEK